MGIPNPGGSGLTVPILGVECDWRTGQPVPLAGTMEDADGKGLVPLAIGFRTIDPITGETGPVIGAQINPWTTAVIPIVQSLGSLPRGSPDPELTDALETEVAAKQRFWRGQREKEEELLKELDFLRLDILEAAKEGKMNKLRYKDKLKPAEEIYRSLEESSNQEAQRRANRQLKAPRDSKPSLQMRVEKDERDQEARVQVLLRKTLEKLVQFVRKVQLDEGRIQMQLKEVERQRSSSLQILETLQETSRKTTLHLVAAFEEHMAKHQANVERACCRLEYLRYLLETVALQTKDLHSGSSQCFVNYPSWRFYGAAGAPQGTWEVINRKLIPLLRSVLETLKESKRSPLSPEVLVGLGSEKGYSSRSTLKVSEVTGEAFRVQTRQEGVPIAAALSPSVASPKRSQLLQEIQARIVLEKHGSEMLHLELSLMAEEIHMITCFWESSRPKKNLGTNLEGSKEWDRLLKELAEYHRHSEEELCRQHSEDVKHAGFGPEGIAFQDGALFSQEEILQNLVSLRLDLQKADSSLTMEASKENNNETQIAEAKLSPAGSTSQKDQAMARKVVKQEALKQIYIHRVLDHYSNLQLEAKETEIVLEAMKPNTSLSAHFIVCFLLSRRHLRQAVLVLEANLELQETGLKTQGDGSSVEDLALDDPLVDQNTKAVVHLLKEKKDYVYSVLQLLQASQMLQLRERQFQEMVQKLKAHSSDQHLEEADQMVRELQEFRQRKTKELEENLRTSLKSPRTQEGRSKNPNDLQSERPLLEKDHKREGKERWQSFQQTWLVELEETYRGQISEEKARLQDQLEKGELKKWSKQNLLREHDETVTFLDKVFQQEMHKRRERMEKERRRRSHPQDGGPPASGSPQERQQPNLVEEDKVFSLLTEYVKILKQTELLVMLRLFLLNPRFRPLLSDGSEADGKPSSQILALLNEVNCQIRKCASAAGLLDNQHEEYDKGTSFRDIMDFQMIPKSGESLVPLVPSSLSAKEFVIYQYGIVVLRFLRPLIGVSCDDGTTTYTIYVADPALTPLLPFLGPKPSQRGKAKKYHRHGLFQVSVYVCWNAWFVGSVVS
ncbi:uncharacterized protein LOC134294709 isoform X6 [Anolis carolinensis]|uniref:uncharacterized protein LOC134294709 isoform X6 n=1 Tax=Anolis carolinensis TaxID=28377 RepID=UPI002F2B5876